jgi:hypothetical protein
MQQRQQHQQVVACTRRAEARMLAHNTEGPLLLGNLQVCISSFASSAKKLTRCRLHLPGPQSILQASLQHQSTSQQHPEQHKKVHKAVQKVIFHAGCSPYTCQALEAFCRRPYNILRAKTEHVRGLRGTRGTGSSCLAAAAAAGRQ